MEIIVEGIGTEFFKPDRVVLNLDFYLKGETYDQVLRDGVSSVQRFVDEILLPKDIFIVCNSSFSFLIIFSAYS